MLSFQQYSWRCLYIYHFGLEMQNFIISTERTDWRGVISHSLSILVPTGAFVFGVGTLMWPLPARSTLSSLDKIQANRRMNSTLHCRKCHILLGRTGLGHQDRIEEGDRSWSVAGAFGKRERRGWCSCWEEGREGKMGKAGVSQGTQCRVEEQGQEPWQVSLPLVPQLPPSSGSEDWMSPENSA